SYPSACFIFVEARKQRTPAIVPITRAPAGPTVPEAGVIATRPATAPEIKPSSEGLPWDTHSPNIHASAAVPVQICVTSIAMPAEEPAATALPALKPNQPTQSIAAPIMDSVRLWGAMIVWP